MKVMSKMGISTYMSYTGAQIFEAVGLTSDLVDQYFKGTASKVDGIGIFEVAEEAIRLHRDAFGDDPVLATTLDAGGEYAYRVRGEEHMWTPDAIAKLQHSTRSNSYQTYKEYAHLINDQTKRHMTFRGLFEFKVDPHKAIPLDEVEPAKEIVKRFATGAMSLGSISHGSARHAGGRDEPHRRQVEHRRRRRGREALSQRTARHSDQERRHDGVGHRRRGRRRHPAEGRRFAALEDQAGGVRAASA